VKRFRISRGAARELDQIWLFIARDNVDAANRLVTQLAGRFRLLATSPKIGRSCNEFKSGLRSSPLGSYVIYYRQTREGVSILHVLHGARDPNPIFTNP